MLESEPWLWNVSIPLTDEQTLQLLSLSWWITTSFHSHQSRYIFTVDYERPSNVEHSKNKSLHSWIHNSKGLYAQDLSKVKSEEILSWKGRWEWTISLLQESLEIDGRWRRDSFFQISDPGETSLAWSYTYELTSNNT